MSHKRARIWIPATQRKWWPAGISQENYTEHQLNKNDLKIKMQEWDPKLESSGLQCWKRTTFVTECKAETIDLTCTIFYNTKMRLFLQLKVNKSCHQGTRGKGNATENG